MDEWIDGWVGKCLFLCALYWALAAYEYEVKYRGCERYSLELLIYACHHYLIDSNSLHKNLRYE